MSTSEIAPVCGCVAAGGGTGRYDRMERPSVCDGAALTESEKLDFDSAWCTPHPPTLGAAAGKPTPIPIDSTGVEC